MKGRAWLELLRAPLLLSPTADVLAGGCVAAAAWAPTASGSYTAGPRESVAALAAALLVPALVGTLLLAGGMALNAVVDADEDRRRKPGRPIPRGDVSARAAATAAAACLLLAAGLAWQLLPAARALVGAMIALILLYHVGLKRLRIAGCAALGLVRAGDLLLGVVALQAALPGAGPGAGSGAVPALDAPVAVVVVAYGLYLFGASLFASTDDEAGAAGWARAGLALALAGLVLPHLGLPPRPGPWDLEGRIAGTLAWVVLAWGLTRILRSARSRPRPATTGALLSGLYLFHASAAFATGWGAPALLAGLAVLLLFGASRLMLRVFPPT